MQLRTHKQRGYTPIEGIGSFNFKYLKNHYHQDTFKYIVYGNGNDVLDGSYGIINDGFYYEVQHQDNGEEYIHNIIVT